jgi:hypothetical protein
MFILITYDVSTSDEGVNEDFAVWRNNALIMGKECKTLSLNVKWTPPNGDRSKRNWRV